MRYKDSGLMERIKAYVEDYAMDHGGATPCMRDIGKAFGIHHSTAYRYLMSMNENGMIRYERGKIHTDRIDKMTTGLKFSPAFSGAIPAGNPDEIDAEVEEYVPIPLTFVDGRNGDYYVLRVSGNSMISAGIDSGDLVIVRAQTEPRKGDIVAALTNGHGSTLKRMCIDDEGAFLWAENDTWSDEERNYGRDFTVQGVAVKVVKDI